MVPEMLLRQKAINMLVQTNSNHLAIEQ